MNTALHGSSTIFLSGSFEGLPLINQALAAENPIGENSFFVTVRALMKVLSQISPSSVVAALAAQNMPSPPAQTPPPSHQTPPVGNPPMVTCNAELDLANPGSGGITNIRIFGGGFVASEIVNIIEFEQIATAVPADTLGGYSITMGVLHGLVPTGHIVRAHGTFSGRTSNNAGFTV
jgi:hypothetical protein